MSAQSRLLRIGQPRPRRGEHPAAPRPAVLACADPWLAELLRDCALRHGVRPRTRE